MTVLDRYDELRQHISQSARSFYLDCLAQHPRETFYGVILYTDNDALFINFRASSEESIRGKQNNRWVMAGWKYEGHTESVQLALEGLWSIRDDSTPDRSWEMIHRLAFKAMVEGMREFAQSDVLNSHAQDDRPVVLLFIGDPDHEMEPQLDEWARQLNPHAKELWFHWSNT